MQADAKAAIREYWERETCGIRYGDAASRKAWHDEIAAARYELEPFIPAFADFPSASGIDVLEIGVGAGTDFANWCCYARHAYGVDLTVRAVEITTERLQLAGVPENRYALRTADAEKLPFADASFDLVYSWGVLHVTPDTPAAIAEAFRVLRPGGRLKMMVYHARSWTGALLAIRFGWLRGKFRMTQKEAIAQYLESPGMKAYSTREAQELLERAGFEQIAVRREFAPGDLLSMRLSAKYRSPIYAVVRALYPSWLIRRVGRRWGLYLMMSARKPQH